MPGDPHDNPNKNVYVSVNFFALFDFDGLLLRFEGHFEINKKKNPSLFWVKFTIDTTARLFTIVKNIYVSASNEFYRNYFVIQFYGDRLSWYLTAPGTLFNP